MPTLRINGLHLILVGEFNPKIFQPAWFAAEKLITSGEAEKAEELAILPLQTHFKLPWATLDVNQERFIAFTHHDTQFEALRDLVVGTFTLLRHTSITKLGINTEQHYLFESEDKWNNFGHTLAPKAIWKSFMNDPGLVSMRMIDKTPREHPRGLTQVDIQGSNLIKPGIFIGVNNHYDCDQYKIASAASAVENLEADFKNALVRSAGIADSIIPKT